MKTSYLILLFTLMLSVYASNTTNTTNVTQPYIYCSSYCIDYVEVCYDDTPFGCMICSTEIFHIIPENGECQVADQHEVVYEGLIMNNMDLTGYQSSSLTPTTCSNYTISGQYTGNHSYIRKEITSLSTNHYELVIRFSIAWIGEWDGTEVLHVDIDGTVYNTTYSCGYSSDLCSGSGADCLKILTITHQHNTTSASIDMRMTMPTDNPSIQYWGIKDLLVAQRQCSGECLTCFGSGTHECLTCAQGHYLQGNKCVTKCKGKKIQDVRQCTEICPQGYFADGSVCEKCQDGCSICSDATNCALWDDGTAGNSVWDQYLLLWILIILSAGILIFLLLYKCLISRQKLADSSEGTIQQHMISENNLQHAENPTREVVEMESMDKKSDGVGFVWNETEPVRTFKKKRRGKMQDDPASLTIEVTDEHLQ